MHYLLLISIEFCLGWAELAQRTKALEDDYFYRWPGDYGCVGWMGWPPPDYHDAWDEMEVESGDAWDEMEVESECIRMNSSCCMILSAHLVYS